MSSYEKTIHWPLSIRFWETGRIYAKGQIEDGLRQGQWTFWYRSGAKQMEGAYVDGVQQGQWTKWWPNGAIATQGAFENGWMHGQWLDYFDSGQKAQESHWDFGRRTGTTTVWDRDTGEVARTEDFDVSKESPMDYPLMTNRDVSFAIVNAQKAGLKMTWSRLVGDKVSRYLDPWHMALWLVLFMFGFAKLQANMGWLAVPAAAAGALVLTIVMLIATLYHDHHTRPDIGISRKKPKD